MSRLVDVREFMVSSWASLSDRLARDGAPYLPPLLDCMYLPSTDLGEGGVVGIILCDGRGFRFQLSNQATIREVYAWLVGLAEGLTSSSV